MLKHIRQGQTNTSISGGLIPYINGFCNAQELWIHKVLIFKQFSYFNRLIKQNSSLSVTYKSNLSEIKKIAAVTNNVTIKYTKMITFFSNYLEECGQKV